MTQSAFSLITLGAIVALLQAAPAQAANNKSWVANSGSDANDCSLAHPCATFQHAHDQTNPGGEVGVLTPGDYGSGLQITKSINITNDKTGEATIRVSANLTGISFNVADGDVMSLRGLIVDGQAIANIGISFVRGSALHIQNCVVRNFEPSNSTGFGIIFEPAGSNPQQLFVSDTLIYNNGSFAGTAGILVSGTFGGSGSLVLDRVHLENNVEGIFINGKNGTSAGLRVIVRDSVISGNAANGIHAETAAGRTPAFAVIERSSIVNNRQNGILADGPGATMLLNDSSVTRNNVGISTVNSGQLISYRNNRINNNVGPDGTPTSFFGLN